MSVILSFYAIYTHTIYIYYCKRRGHLKTDPATKGNVFGLDSNTPFDDVRVPLCSKLTTDTQYATTWKEDAHVHKGYTRDEKRKEDSSSFFLYSRNLSFYTRFPVRNHHINVQHIK